MTRDAKKLGITMWLLVVTYYLYQYILRVSPSIMKEEVMISFQVDADGFGSLAAVSTFFYALLQIPGGILSDFYGARRMILISLLLCTLGVTLFAITDHLSIAYLARVLIGSGSACAFLCASKVSSDWFSVEKKSLMFALTVTAGTMGALLGGRPLTALNSSFGWRQSFYLLAFLGIVIFILNLLFMRDRHTLDLLKKGTVISRPEIWGSIKEIFKSRFCWMYAIIALGIYLSISVFADLWGVSFLMLKYDLPKEIAAQAISMIYVGTCFGVIIIAGISHFLRDYRSLIIGGSALLMASLLTLLVFGNIASIWGMYLALFALGFFAGGEVLCFSNACEAMSISVAASVTGFINFIVTLGAALTQKLIGYAINILWDGSISESGMPLYTLENYQTAMLFIIIMTFISFVLSFFLNSFLNNQTSEAL